MGQLDGRHALVTGAGTGIGAATARTLAAAGAAVSLVGRRKEPLMEVAATLRKTAVIAADVTHEDDCARMACEAREALGPVDIVVANAGIAESAPFAKTSLAQWQRIMDVNVTGAFLTVRALLPDLLRKEDAGLRRVVFMASTAALHGSAYVAAYCASKHAVLGLARAMAVEFEREPLTVNAVCPGYTDTPLLDAAVAKITATTGRPAGEARGALAKRNENGRLITPEEVAQKVLWLCSPEADSVSGQALVIAGGQE